MLFRIVLAAALAAPLFAGDDYWRGRGNGHGNDGRRNRGWSDNYRYRDTAPAANAIINRALRDLRTAASRNRVDSHERNHFSRAMYELQNMRGRNAYIDPRRLDHVIDDMRDLAQAHQIHPRDRQMIARSLRDLQSLHRYNDRW